MSSINLNETPPITSFSPSNGSWNSRSFLKQLLILVGYQLLTCLMFSSVALSHNSTFLVWQDASEQSYPWLTKVWQAARVGELALWDFGIYSGTSFVGELQTAPFYPLSLAFSVIAKTTSPRFVDAFLLMHFGLAAFFTHQFLRGVGASGVARVLGAVIFAFASPFALRSMGQPNIFCGLIYMPAATLCILNALRAKAKSRAVGWTMLAGLSLSLSILAGHVHSYIHIVVVLGLTCLVHRIQYPSTPLFRLLSIFFGALALSLLGASVQLIATREYLELAYKWYSDGHFTRSPHIVPFAEMARNAIPASAFQTAFPWSPRMTAGVSLFTTYSSLPLALISLATLNSFSGKWAWMTIIASLFLATAGSSWSGPFLHHTPGLNLVREPDRALHIYAFGVAVAAALGLDVLLKRIVIRWWQIAALCLLCGGGLVEAYLFDKQMVIPITYIRCPYVQYSEPVLNYLKSRTTHDDSRYRFYQLSTDQIPPNAGEVVPVSNLMGYRASMQGNYFDFLSQSWDLSSQNMDLLSVRYVVTEKTLQNFPQIFASGSTKVYERKSALPIFWNLDRIGNKCLPKISSVTWKSNSVLLKIDSINDGFLIFSQPEYPGWVAYVNGQKRAVSKWGIFVAVPISHSDSDVKFAYEPAWLIPFGFLSSVTLLACSMIPLLVFLLLNLKPSEHQRNASITLVDFPGAE